MKAETSDHIIEIRDYHQEHADKIRDFYHRNSSLLRPSSSDAGSLPRVPSKLLKLDTDTYQPHIVSIGPYHYGSVESMKYKRAYMDAYIRRYLYSHQQLYESFRQMEVAILWCYGEQQQPGEDLYLKNIVDDGCFILELLVRYQEDHANIKSKDSIFSTTWLVPALRRDLVLLDNQIPFFVLDLLYTLVTWPPHTPSLVQLILDFFDPILPTISLRRKTHATGSKHILDLLRSHLIYPYQTEDFKDIPTSESGALETFFELSEIMWFGDNPTWEYTTSATELQAAGVKFRKNDSADCLLDIRFTSRDGKLEMPPFFLGESWTVLFPNLIALEQCHRDYPARITSYVLLVHKLMSSPSDRKLLRAKGIIDGYSRKDEKVFHVIGGLLQEVVVDKFYYDRLCNAINAYCCKFSNRLRRTLVRNFFNTPRQAVSSVAVAVLILLVSAQVVFTILS